MEKVRAMGKQSKFRHYAFGLASTILGSSLVFATVVFINKYAEGPQNDKIERQASIDFEKKEKPKPKKVVKKKEPPKRQPNRQPPAPLVGLDSSLGGLDLGIPGFESDDLGNLTKSLLGDADSVVMTDDAVDNPPRPAVQSPMPYPPRAKAKGQTGYVLLTVLISPTGDVERVKVLESQPSGVFDDVAMSGVRQWKFEPAMYQGENVRVWAKQRVVFDLS